MHHEIVLIRAHDRSKVGRHAWLFLQFTDNFFFVVGSGPYILLSAFAWYVVDASVFKPIVL